jgi:Zn-dependent protease
MHHFHFVTKLKILVARNDIFFKSFEREVSMFFQYLFTDFQYFFWWICILVFSVCLHELFHALAAYWEGDSTAKDQGYFTLNPLIHMGPASLVLLLLTGMCWGLCPVDPSKFRHKYGDALVSFAGPFANLLLLIVAAGLACLLMAVNFSFFPSVVQMNLLKFLQLFAYVNAALFLFNLIPIPPLDGHAIVGSFFPNTKPIYAQLGDSGFIVLFLLMSISGGSRLLWGCAEILAGSCFSVFSAMLA